VRGGQLFFDIRSNRLIGDLCQKMLVNKSVVIVFCQKSELELIFKKEQGEE